MLQMKDLTQGEDASIAIGNPLQVVATKETVESKDERYDHSKTLGRLGILL